MKNTVHSVGVDLGGTWIRVYAVDKHGRLLKHLRSPSPKIKALPLFLSRLWRLWKIVNLDYLTVGSRGVWLIEEKQALQRSLRKLAMTVRVVSDVELAFESALTPRKQAPGRAAGILLLAGTGSIAVGRNERGRVSRTGGLGPLKGDEGSGYWIGREYAKRVLSKKRNKSSSISETASFANMVLKRASHNLVCQKIRQEAQMHLSDLVLQLAKQLKFRGQVAVSWAGGFIDK